MTAAHHETPDLTELRRLAEAATPGPWESDGLEVCQHWSLPEPWHAVVNAEISCGPYCYGGSVRPIERDADAAYIAALSPAVVLALLDERDALAAKVERVRALHASSGTAESQGYDAEGEYGLIAPYCTGCEASDEYATAWPCPTIRALDTTPDTGGECDLCKRGHELAGDSDYMSTDTHRGL